MIQTFFHIALSCILLLGSSGILLNKHFCQSKLKNIAIFVSAENCHTKKAKNHCKKHADDAPAICSSEDEKNCCQNESDYLKLEIEQICPGWNDLSNTQQIFLTSFAHSFIWNLYENIELSSQDYLNYKPPLLLRDIVIDSQSFLC